MPLFTTAAYARVIFHGNSLQRRISRSVNVGSRYRPAGGKGGRATGCIFLSFCLFTPFRPGGESPTVRIYAPPPTNHVVSRTPLARDLQQTLDGRPKPAPDSVRFSRLVRPGVAGKSYSPPPPCSRTTLPGGVKYSWENVTPGKTFPGNLHPPPSAGRIGGGGEIIPGISYPVLPPGKTFLPVLYVTNYFSINTNIKFKGINIKSIF